MRQSFNRDVWALGRRVITAAEIMEYCGDGPVALGYREHWRKQKREFNRLHRLISAAKRRPRRVRPKRLVITAPHDDLVDSVAFALKHIGLPNVQVGTIH